MLVLKDDIISRFCLFFKRLFLDKLPSYMYINDEDKKNLLIKLKKDYCEWPECGEKKLKELREFLIKNQIDSEKAEEIIKDLRRIDASRISGYDVKERLLKYNSNIKEEVQKEIINRVDDYAYAISLGIFYKNKLVKMLEKYFKRHDISLFKKYIIENSFTVDYCDDNIFKKIINNIVNCDYVMIKEIKSKYNEINKETIINYLSDILSIDYKEIEDECQSNKLNEYLENKLIYIIELINDLEKVNIYNKKIYDISDKCNNLLNIIKKEKIV